jgi:ketosteroid isomerase-like protein
MEELGMDNRQSNSQDEAAIRDIVEFWAAAVRRKDFGEILKNHSSDIVMFDVPPPFQSKGIEAYKKTWDLFFSCSGDPIVFDIATMTITAASDVAFVVATMRCTEPGANGERQGLEFRLTIGLCKIGGQWTITHEHHSVPAKD